MWVRVQPRWRSFLQRRKRRQKARRLMTLALLSFLPIFASLNLFLMGTVAASFGQHQTKWYMYIAGNVALILSTIPFSVLIRRLVENKLFDCTNLPMAVYSQDNEPLVSRRVRNRENAFHTPQQVPEDSSAIYSADSLDRVSSSTNVDDLPPSYEIALRLQNNSSV